MTQGIITLISKANTCLDTTIVNYRTKVEILFRTRSVNYTPPIVRNSPTIPAPDRWERISTLERRENGSEFPVKSCEPDYHNRRKLRRGGYPS